MRRIVEMKQGARVAFIGSESDPDFACLENSSQLVDGFSKGLPYPIPIGIRGTGKARAFRFE
ncbi:hypothetical protein EKH55_5706 (plasmid) [Sinorhizobium alkalisoli]|nr:hypothetical protein EKH55_5706 [Sinorhizobium alkalisoli]